MRLQQHTHIIHKDIHSQYIIKTATSPSEIKASNRIRRDGQSPLFADQWNGEKVEVQSATAGFHPMDVPRRVRALPERVPPYNSNLSTFDFPIEVVNHFFLHGNGRGG